MLPRVLRPHKAQTFCVDMFLFVLKLLARAMKERGGWFVQHETGPRRWLSCWIRA